MTVTVQASDVIGTALQAAVTAQQTLFNNAATTNPAQAAQYLAVLTASQIALINYLLGNAFSQTAKGPNFAAGSPNFLTPAGILSAGTINT
jgi:short subunit dehydrogenase-like uncharacterized protein